MMSPGTPLRFTCCTLADSWDGPLGNGEFEDKIDLAFSIGFLHWLRMTRQNLNCADPGNSAAKMTGDLAFGGACS